MRVLVVSDTHGHAEQLKRVMEKVRSVDALIHCGDIEGQEAYIRDLMDCPCYMVAGIITWGRKITAKIVRQRVDYPV